MGAWGPTHPIADAKLPRKAHARVLSLRPRHPTQSCLTFFRLALHKPLDTQANDRLNR